MRPYGNIIIINNKFIHIDQKFPSMFLIFHINIVHICILIVIAYYAIWEKNPNNLCLFQLFHRFDPLRATLN